MTICLMEACRDGHVENSSTTTVVPEMGGIRSNHEVWNGSGSLLSLSVACRGDQLG